MTITKARFWLTFFSLISVFFLALLISAVTDNIPVFLNLISNMNVWIILCALSLAYILGILPGLLMLLVTAGPLMIELWFRGIGLLYSLPLVACILAVGMWIFRKSEKREKLRREMKELDKELDDDNKMAGIG